MIAATFGDFVLAERIVGQDSHGDKRDALSVASLRSGPSSAGQVRVATGACANAKESAGAIGWRSIEIRAQIEPGEIDLAKGDLAGAVRELDGAKLMAWSAGERFLEVDALGKLGIVAKEEGDADLARRQFGLSSGFPSTRSIRQARFARVPVLPTSTLRPATSKRLRRAGV